MARTLIRTNEFDEFYDSLEDRIREKVDYVLSVMMEIKVVSTKFVKKLERTEFYEMRVSVNNEYRIIIFTIDDDNFVNAENVLLLNGFVKKSTKDYGKQIRLARTIIEKYSR